MKTSKKKKPGKRGRSAKTGKFIPVEEAVKSDTAVVETVKRRGTSGTLAPAPALKPGDVILPGKRKVHYVRHVKDNLFIASINETETLIEITDPQFRLEGKVYANAEAAALPDVAVKMVKMGAGNLKVR